MRTHKLMYVALFAMLPTAGIAAEESLRGSPASMTRQHNMAVEDDRTFFRTPKAVLKEVEAGTLTHLAGNEDYRTANVSFPYAAEEVRMLVERVAREYRAACGEQLVVTSLTRPSTKQPRNAHALSVHPAGVAVDLRISKRSDCRVWLERTLLALEAEEVLDVTREKRPPHYHVAVFVTKYRAYAERQDSTERALLAAQKAQQERAAMAVAHSGMATLPGRDGRATAWLVPMIFLVTSGLTALGAVRRRLRQR